MFNFYKINRLLIVATGLIVMSVEIPPPAQAKNLKPIKLICGFASGSTLEGQAFAPAFCKSLEQDLKRELGLNVSPDPKNPHHIIDVKLNLRSQYALSVTIVTTTMPGGTPKSEAFMIGGADQPLAANASRNLMRPLATILGLL